MAKSTTTRLNNWLPLLFLFGLIFLWEIVIKVFKIPPYLIPSPFSIATDFIADIQSLLFHASITLWEATLGLMIAIILGITIANVFVWSSTLEKGLYPLAIASKTTPIIAMAPLLVLWFGNGSLSKVVAATLIAFFPILVNTVKGLKTVDGEALELFESLTATKIQTLTKLRFYSALPYIFSAAKVSTSLAVVGAIVGEFVGANKGLGYLILVNSYHLETVKMFSAVIAAAILGILLFWIVSTIEKRIVFWQVADE